MPRHRTALPNDLKELIQLIRQGRLYEVSQWIDDGKNIRLPDQGNFVLSPLLAAVRTGFHSMVELLLEQLSKEADLDGLLHEAVCMGRLDLIELLHRFGADPKSIEYEIVASSHNPLILRWFEDRGIDLECDYALASAFRWRRRAALGTYMRHRKAMPQLQTQLNMALRHHAATGDLKWVCLLLWAGADARAQVPKLDSNYPEDEVRKGKALADAVLHGHVEIIKKFKLDPKKDDLNALLHATWLTANREIIELLIELGADPAGDRTTETVRTYVQSLGWALETNSPFRRDYRALTEALCLLARNGARWATPDKRDFRTLRVGLSQTDRSTALDVLRKLVDAGFFSQEVFRSLVNTPRMKEVIDPGLFGNCDLWEFAGLPSLKKRRRTLRRKLR
jgi:hypothetical protein